MSNPSVRKARAASGNDEADPDSRIADVLNRHLARLHMTDAELSRKSLLSSAQIQRLRKGSRKNSSLDTVEKLARGLNVSPEALVGEIFAAGKPKRWKASLPGAPLSPLDLSFDDAGSAALAQAQLAIHVERTRVAVLELLRHLTIPEAAAMEIRQLLSDHGLA